MSENRIAFENPFATRYTRPGAVRYLFSDGETAEHLLERLRSNHGWGQIVGPHGVGKSTLLATLLPLLEEAGFVVHSIALHDGQRRLGREVVAGWTWTNQTLIIVDGYEQLSFLSRYLLKRRCRRCGAGLLVTAHADVGLPSLTSVGTGTELVKRLVQNLTRDSSGWVPDDCEMDSLVAEHGDNVRELLFDLYNRYERQGR